MLKRIIILILALAAYISLFSHPVFAGWVNGYFRNDGTYVNGYYKSDPNGLRYDNYSWEWGDDLYNSSYYDTGRSSEWYTPSWEWQDDYWTGLNSYGSNNDYEGWWSTPTYDSYDSYFPSYDYDYDYDYDYYDWDW